MTRIESRTVQAAKIAARAMPEIGLPMPVARDGSTPARWADCVKYVLADAPTLTVDDVDLVNAIEKAPEKVRPGDTTKEQLKTRLATEYAEAKAEREAAETPRAGPATVDEPLTRRP